MAHFSNDEYGKVVRAGVIGHAVGDAMGVPVEFMTRDELKEYPVTEMTGGGAHYAPAGTWSDDTSMEIALMQSVINCGSINYRDIMDKFCNWMLHDEFTATGHILDLSETCNKALNNYSYHNLDPTSCGGTSEMSNSNGSLMRILPVAFICERKAFSVRETYGLVKDVSSLTHAHPVSILGCHIYINFIRHLLEGCSPNEAYFRTRHDDYEAYEPAILRRYNRILKDDIIEVEEEKIVAGLYVVETLEAALWCTLTTDSYEKAILTAVNLGEDTDTVGAVTGSMAGIIYGYDAIPKSWLKELKRLDYLLDICDNFTEAITT